LIFILLYIGIRIENCETPTSSWKNQPYSGKNQFFHFFNPKKMKQIFTNPGRSYVNNFTAATNFSLILKPVISCTLLLLLTMQISVAQTGYLYVHIKSLSQDLSQTFTFSISGGSTAVPNFTLEDQPLNIEPTDIGAGHGTGAGELWTVSGATQGASGSIYHRAANSTTWNLISGQTGSAIDGADLGHFVIVNNNGDGYVYNGSSFIKIYDHSSYNAPAIDISNNGSITSGIGFTAIVDASGHVWEYTGDYSSTFTWSDITPVNNSGKNFTRLDINASNNDIVLNDASGYVSKINSAGGGLVYYGRTASAPSQMGDITVDNNGTMYSLQKDAQGMDAAYRYNGSTWIEEPETGLHYFLTSSDAGQIWIIKGYTATQSSSFANQSTIYTRVGDGSGTWLDDERVQTSQNDNAIMIPVAAGTYTISEANVSSWNLQSITIYDSTSGSAPNVAGNSAKIVVSAGQVAHVLFVNGLVVPLPMPLSCGSTNAIQNFGSGANNTKGGPLTGNTNFHYYTDPSKNTTPDGYYSLAQNSNQWGNGGLTDHTGLTGGYFLMINASYAPNEFYKQRITGMIPGTQYKLAFWAANLSPGSPLQPNILAGITDTSTGVIIGSVSTGSLPTDNAWHQYSFTFTATVTTGDVFLQNNAPGGFGNDLAIDDITFTNLCLSILPETILNFNAEKKDNNVSVSWSTTSNIKFDHFEIERSADGNSWKTIGNVAGNTDNATLDNYSYTDYSPLGGANYYRLKSVSDNGQWLYSEVRLVNFSGNGQWSISMYPNPVSNGSVVKFESNEPLQAIRVFDINGTLMMIRNIGATEAQGNVDYTLNTSNFAEGMYMVQMISAKGKINNLKLLKKN
jgi:hypothetical protein